MTESELLSLLQIARSARQSRPEVPLALATLVAVDGSSYRQPGARMLCDADGRVLAGAISGGCLEQDVAARASAVCAAEAGCLVSYDLREDLETIWGFGTGCEGVAHILLAPLPDLDVLEQAAFSAQHRAPGTLLTLVQSSEPRRVGTLSFVAASDRRVSSAHPHHSVDHVSHTVARTDRPFLGAVSPAPQHAQWFGSPVRPAVQLVIVGASRGAESMARVAIACGWNVVVIDHRVEALDALDLAERARRVVIDPLQALAALRDAQVATDAYTAFALCTHRFEHDRDWIAALLPTTVPYIGVLGSRQRASRLMRTFADAGLPLRARDRNRLFAPIGLDLGGESPDEIALAAVAEIQAVLQARPGGSLRARQSPLHTRSETPSLPPERVTSSCQLASPDATGSVEPDSGDAPRPRDRR